MPLILVYVGLPCFDALCTDAKDLMKESFVVEPAEPLAIQKVADVEMSMV
jgi:hypothetical protein